MPAVSYILQDVLEIDFENAEDYCSPAAAFHSVSRRVNFEVR
jgi:hypothetical protein